MTAGFAPRLVRPDYIRELNRLTDDLLHSHGELRAKKNIARKRELIRVIKLDLDKLTHALVEVKDNSALEVLSRFCAGSSVDPASVLARLAGPGLYHVGFEIHEPLDLVLRGIQHWIDHSVRNLGKSMRIHDYHRFPASQAFQQRVGAETEIMRIWLEVGGRVLMLELFDIHRPVGPVLAAAPASTHRNFHGLFQSGGPRSPHAGRLRRLFADDAIWHYALFVDGPANVEALHAQWQEVAAGDVSFRMPYAAPVHNAHDRSFHTKVVRLGQERLELEFVTQLPE